MRSASEETLVELDCAGRLLLVEVTSWTNGRYTRGHVPGRWLKQWKAN